jgi:hypothetical protein
MRVAATVFGSFPKLLVASALLSALVDPLPAQEPSPRSIQFNRDIRPILSENCFQCHGPDAAHREADLRLDLREDAIGKREHGAAIAPGSAIDSQLIARITSTDPDLKMPPAESGRKLTPEQTTLLQQWIEQGAQYEAHWSLVAPQPQALPAVKDRAWPRNPIDYFILAKLEQEGLTPSPEAKHETWLRRVTLDLTGLPPTPHDLHNFLADKSPQAHERVVDRLLASEHFGERMAMHWLDLARYADTNGYNNDEERTQWPWRDWVIDAFNRNMPYDQFVLEQLAGDLLPNSTDQQKIATAFNRNHVLTTEGGIIEEEYRVEYVADRVHTTSTVFLGLSLQCARCHDHKYDPLSQQDYYRFFAFFNNIDEKTVGYNQARISEPLVKAPTQHQARQLEKLATHFAQIEKQRADRAASIDEELAKWETETASHLASDNAAQSASVLAAGLVLRLPLDETSGDKATESISQKPIASIRGKASWSPGKIKGGLEFDGQTHVDLGEQAAFEHSDAFSLAAWVYPTSSEAITVLSKIDEANAHRGYDLVIEEGKVAMHIVHHWPDNGLKVIAKKPLKLNEWQHVAVTYDGKSKAQGIKLYVDGQVQPLDAANDKLSGAATIKTERPFHVGRRSTSIPFRGKLDDIRVYKLALSAHDVNELATGLEAVGLIEILKARSSERTAAQRDQLRKYFLESVDAACRELSTQLADLTRQKEEIHKAFPATMVMAEMPQPRQAYLLKRGQYDQRGDALSAGVPASLPPLPSDAPANRLGLAKWLVDPAHPLTARVAVNRWWQMFFGAGLVETVEDFGAQGAWPTHPELLDWLAIELSQKQSWNVKAILKQIVLSSTYRQSSNVTPELLKRDPKNQLLARGPRFRLPAETIRDSALAMSGLLSPTVGGPSVRPYQPDGLWQDVSVERRAVYERDKGPDLYRRSMYTFWKRTCPPPGMTTFDAPDRETCTIRRARTNTPLQALVLMNDPTYLEAARKLAERAMVGGDADEPRLIQLLELSVSRKPAAKESQVLLEMLAAARQKFLGSPGSAEKLLSVGDSPRNPKLDANELAAWTTLASVVLSLDETISKE